MTRTARVSWKEIRDRIHATILDGTYAPGQKLPRDEDLADRLGCARSTIQRAMQDLSDSGIIERRRKGGTRVRPDPVTRATFDIPVTRIEVEDRGARYRHQLISSAMVLPPDEVAAELELTAPYPFHRVRALHLADDKPYMLEDRWVCPRTVPEFAHVDLHQQSANEWLVRNKPYTRCDLRFYAIRATSDVARELATEPGDALFVMQRTTWSGTAPITTVQAIGAPGYQLVTRS